MSGRLVSTLWVAFFSICIWALATAAMNLADTIRARLNDRQDARDVDRWRP